MAMMHGSPQHPEIHGTVSFYRACGGSLVVAELYQLPSAHDIFAMHIHSGASCTETAQDAFADAGGHWELQPAEHPQHTGDLPALLSNDAMRGLPCIPTGFLRHRRWERRSSFTLIRMTTAPSLPEMPAHALPAGQF